MGGSEQFPCVCDILQAVNERPESFSEEKVEAPGPRRGAADQKYDWETLGNNLRRQKVTWVINIVFIPVSQNRIIIFYSSSIIKGGSWLTCFLLLIIVFPCQELLTLSINPLLTLWKDVYNSMFIMVIWLHYWDVSVHVTVSRGFSSSTLLYRIL